MTRANSITTETLIRETTDLHRLADFPTPAYRNVQFSSYDRASQVPGGPGWFANCDGFGNEATPNFVAVLKPPNADGIGEYLICDLPGPGAIVRTWTAGMRGELRLFLDDADTPLYSGSAAKFLLCPYAAWIESAGLESALLDNTFRQSYAGYCPIPFAGRCRMTWTGNLKELHFYHVNVRIYEPGAPVQTFRTDDLKTYAAAIREAAAVLTDPDAKYPYRAALPPVEIAAVVEPGQVVEALSLTGPRMIERLTLKVAATDLDRALRQTLLRIVCDDFTSAQVQAPIGDFFGTAPGVNPYASLPLSVAPDGTMTCRYVMPFKTSLKILLDNRGTQPVRVSGAALPADYAWNDDNSMHFRARWRVDHDLVGDHENPQDIPYLIANGCGVYVGTALMLLNPCAPPTPWGGWWGEGDEKVFVDEDTFPSTFGTGSEDYFNYAWSLPDIFAHAYCGQPRDDGPGNRGFVVNYRWHILDPIPFRRRLAFYMELLTHERTAGISYARIAYHYARPGLIDDHVAITGEDVRQLELPPAWQPAPRFASHGVRFHSAEDLVAPDAGVTLERNNLWAGGELMVWKPAAVGDEITLRVPVAEDGPHAFLLGLALDARAGTISAKLDGRALAFNGDAGVLDLYSPHRVMLRQFESTPTPPLTQGDHTLTIRCETLSLGASPTGFGIDYLGVQHR